MGGEEQKKLGVMNRFYHLLEKEVKLCGLFFKSTHTRTHTLSGVKQREKRSKSSLGPGDLLGKAQQAHIKTEGGKWLDIGSNPHSHVV